MVSIPATGFWCQSPNLLGKSMELSKIIIAELYFANITHKISMYYLYAKENSNLGKISTTFKQFWLWELCDWHWIGKLGFYQKLVLTASRRRRSCSRSRWISRSDLAGTGPGLFAGLGFRCSVLGTKENHEIPHKSNMEARHLGDNKNGQNN